MSHAPPGAWKPFRWNDSDDLMSRLRGPGPLVTVELRPPPSDLGYASGVDAWIDLHHSISRLAKNEVFVFLTDDAVGEREEENLGHLASNLGRDVPVAQLVPFLTSKHELEYCLKYAERADALGFRALTVLGGDQNVGLPRCFPHAFQLRKRIRQHLPRMLLGGWANPHRDASEQVGFVVDPAYSADFYLTQVVSHHSAHAVEAFLEEAGRRGVEIPGVFGVFYYRSARPETLDWLGRFFPVPSAEITHDFDAGLSPEDICARTIKALRRVGAEKIYVSNLGQRGVEARLARILERVGF
ncbi:MAG: hypothetical protein BMS9Abin29_0773 [Gemmatimonadota bacterium]|nr:MAG: hypothetical protein BMS9Abin29_0773 [Gemmatimonadota bacterium]